MPRLIFPRGFEVPSAETAGRTGQRTDGSREIMEMYKDYISKRINSNEFEFVKRVMGLAKAYMGISLRQWVNTHNQSEYIDPMASKFIEDTLTFLVTGRRTISSMGWIDLLTTQPEANQPGSVVVKYDEIVAGGNLGAGEGIDQNYLRYWLSQPKGMDDLVNCLVAMYGSKAPHSIKTPTINMSAKNPTLQKLLNGPGVGRPM